MSRDNRTDPPDHDPNPERRVRRALDALADAEARGRALGLAAHALLPKLALAFRVKADHGKPWQAGAVWCGHRKMAHLLGRASRHSVIRALDELIDSGLLHDDGLTPGGAGEREHVYRFGKNVPMESALGQNARMGDVLTRRPGRPKKNPVAETHRVSRNNPVTKAHRVSPSPTRKPCAESCENPVAGTYRNPRNNGEHKEQRTTPSGRSAPEEPLPLFADDTTKTSKVEAEVIPLTPALVPARGGGWPARAFEAYEARMGGASKALIGRIGKALAPVVVAVGEEAALLAWSRYLRETTDAAKWIKPESFADRYGVWLDGGPGESKGGKGNTVTAIKDAVAGFLADRKAAP